MFNWKKNENTQEQLQPAQDKEELVSAAAVAELVEKQVRRALQPSKPGKECGVCHLWVEAKDGHNYSVNGETVWACSYCTHYEDDGDYGTLLDYAVCTILGFQPGQRILGCGELFPHPPSNVKRSTKRRFAWITEAKLEELATAFDFKYPSGRMNGYMHTPLIVRNPGKLNERIEYGEDFFTRLPQPLKPPRSNLRPLLPSEKLDREIEQLQHKLAVQVQQQESRKARKQAQLEKLQREVEQLT